MAPGGVPNVKKISSVSPRPSGAGGNTSLNFLTLDGVPGAVFEGERIWN